MNPIVKSNKTSTSSILASTIENVTAGLTGVIASDKNDFIISFGHILQRCRGGGFLKQFRDEWDKYIEKGIIKDDYQYTDQHLTCLQEMLDFLENDITDELRFMVLKKIFFVAAKEEILDRDNPLPAMYIKICRSLSSGEILVLKTIFDSLTTAPWKDIIGNSASDWLNYISKKSGLLYPELVELYEQELIVKNLITPREHTDKSGINKGEHFRLTNLGYNLCCYIEAYDSIEFEL